MQVIEAQRASILVPHDHLHINQMRTFTPSLMMHKYTVQTTIYWVKPGLLSGRPAPG
jgi:hypothetical protein